MYLPSVFYGKVVVTIVVYNKVTFPCIIMKIYLKNTRLRQQLRGIIKTAIEGL